MDLILNYDSSCENAPAGFESVLNNLAQAFDETFSNPVTVTIDVGYGENVNGQALPPFVNAENFTNGLVSYDGLTMTPANAAALGDTNVPTLDGTIDFANLAQIFDYSGGVPPSSEYDFAGVAANEFSQIMGRQMLAPFGQGSDPLDQLHYSSPGILDTSWGGYVSVDGGNSVLGYTATNHNQDPGNWQSTTPDAFMAASLPGVLLPITPDDLAVMNAIGWNNAGYLQGGGGVETTGGLANGAVSSSEGMTVDGCTVEIASGGTASGAIVTNGGVLDVLSGAVTSGMSVGSGGTVTVSSGGTVEGHTNVDRGVLILDAGADFESHARLALTHNGLLILDQDSFDGTIKLSHGQDYMDLSGIRFIGQGPNATTATFTQTTAAGGVLDVAQGAHAIDLHLAGTYTTANFVPLSDGAHGTTITFVP
jgi:autotransporter passenger strand-loop-strand repeat protein